MRLPTSPMSISTSTVFGGEYGSPPPSPQWGPAPLLQYAAATAAGMLVIIKRLPVTIQPLAKSYKMSRYQPHRSGPSQARTPALQGCSRFCSARVPAGDGPFASIPAAIPNSARALFVGVAVAGHRAAGGIRDSPLKRRVRRSRTSALRRSPCPTGGSKGPDARSAESSSRARPSSRASTAQTPTPI